MRTGVADVVFNSMSEDLEFSDNIWIGDSGASCQYSNSDKGLFDIKEVSESIIERNGKTIEATKMGNLRCDVERVNGKTFQVELQDVKYVPELWVNLFSINKALKNGFKIGNDGMGNGWCPHPLKRFLVFSNGFDGLHRGYIRVPSNHI